jgi:hypothetical protein
MRRPIADRPICLGKRTISFAPPVLLCKADAVIQRAPLSQLLSQFLHQTNPLDTLGVDAPESVGRF